MSKQANPAMVGGFVLGAVALAVAGLVVFGGGKFFANTRMLVSFFDGNVNGLAIGAPVSFRGVKFGEVTEIRLLTSAKTGEGNIEVIYEVQRDVAEVVDEDQASPRAQADFAKFLIEKRGMKAQLASQSMVTGQLYIDLDFYPDVKARLVGLNTKYLEIPTIPSNMEQIKNTIGDAVAKFRALPLDEIVGDLRDTMRTIKDLVGSEDVRLALHNLTKTLADIDELVNNVDAKIDPMATDLQGVTVAARGTLTKAEDALGGIAEAVAPGSALRYQITQMIEELSAASRSIRVLADYLEQNPNSVLFGKREEAQ